MLHSFDIIVIGGGIAGLTAGREAARLGRSTLVLTGNTLGGHLLNIESVEGWPDAPEGIAGYDLCPIAQEAAGEAGALFEMLEADSLEREGPRWRISAGGHDYSAGAVILATGAALKKLGVPGEDAFEGRGVSHCASCDAPLLRGREVVVAGGGDSALQETLALLGPAAKITIVCAGAALTAQENFQARVLASGKVHVRTGARIAEILGGTGVTGVRLASGEEIPCAAVFPFVGMTPNSHLAADIAALDSHRAVIADPHMRSSAAGLLAAGTIRADAPFRAAACATDGAIAAQAAHAWLLDGAWPVINPIN